MARGRRAVDESALRPGQWWVRIATLLIGVLVAAVSVQRDNGWLQLIGLCAGGFPAGWAALQLTTRSGLGRGWRAAATLGTLVFVICGASAIGDLWRSAVGQWQSAVVAQESSHCTGRYGCRRQYTVSLVGVPGQVREDHQGQLTPGSSVRVLVDPTSLVPPSKDAVPDRLWWNGVPFVLGAVPLIVVAVASRRRSRTGRPAARSRSRRGVGGRVSPQPGDISGPPS